MPELPPRSLALALAVSWAFAPAAAMAEPYRLHIQDRLSLRVMAWDFAQGNLGGIAVVSGEYTIDSEGTLQVPLAGVVRAEGRTTAELRAEISDLIRRSAGLDRPPELSVELAASLPVYVMGMAQTPGAVAFRPGLSARQALVLAGGPYRAAAGADPLKQAALAGDEMLARQVLAGLHAERKMVQADLRALDTPAPTPDPQPQTRPSTRDLLLSADAQARQARAESLDAMAALLAEKIDRLGRQITLRDEQIAAHRADLAGVEALKDKGLANNARLTALSTALSDLEARRIDLETTLLLAEQQLNETRRNRRAIADDARAGLLRRLAGLEDEISAATIRLDTARRLQGQLALAADTQDSAAPQLRFTLIRQEKDDTRHSLIDPDTPLEPGDVLDITLAPGNAP